MRTHLLFVAVVLAVSTSAHAQTKSETKWVPAANKACSQVCADQKLLPVGGGLSGPNKNRYYVCAVDANGMRPGFTVVGITPGNSCIAGFGGKGTARPNAQCLCSTDKIEIN